MKDNRKTAIVTGGSRGIGFSIAQQLGLDGFNLVLFARNGNIGNFTQLEELGISFQFVSGDLSSSTDRKLLVDTALENYGSIQVLVNSAGVAPLERKDILEMTEKSYDRVMDVNTKGTLFLTQLVAKQMLGQNPVEGRKGTIVNISSCSAVVSSPNRAEYCISKAGISMLTTLFADRLASEGILVHEVRPGVIETDMTATVKGKYDKLFSEGVFPIARWGKPEDVAHVVSFMVSEGFSYTTGDYVDVDGGFHIQHL